ncbi:hypothetical protein H6776_01550 [Candidatus Nomurabacteria bacterium]|nr:hypothetical protein [Candidatus Nomurabacteria bacterium]
MDNQEKAKKIEEIYQNAQEKLQLLAQKQHDIIQGYIKELEEEKMQALRQNISQNYQQ